MTTTAAALDRFRRAKPTHVVIRDRTGEETRLQVPKGRSRWVRTLEMVEHDYPSARELVLIGNQGAEVARLPPWWASQPEPEQPHEQLDPEMVQHTILLDAVQVAGRIQAETFDRTAQLIERTLTPMVELMTKMLGERERREVEMLDKYRETIETIGEEGATTEQDVQLQLIASLEKVGAILAKGHLMTKAKGLNGTGSSA